MKLGYTIIYVPSVPDTLNFYERAFGMTRHMLTPEEDYGELDTGETTLAFASEQLGKSNGLTLRHHRPGQPAAAFEIALVTEHVEQAYTQAINQGAEPVNPPQKKPWGQLVGYVSDPNGVLIELCSPIS